MVEPLEEGQCRGTEEFEVSSIFSRRERVALLLAPPEQAGGVLR